MTKPFGYYGLKIDADIEAAIDDARLEVLLEGLEHTATELMQDLYYSNDDAEQVLYEESLLPRFPALSSSNQIGMIRALCDRIEKRLMEAAK